ncbi:MAG: DUF5106 domain-containing protein [Chitinophagaceae bacterium]|nr:DUF5106 domain-containing protein [Chitinophagaceae bacterium]
MKKLLLIPVLLISAWACAQAGYEIKVTFKPFRNQYVYLGHYSGKQFPIIDSVKLNDKSEGVFRGPKPLGGGIYVIAYPTRDRFFELLIDKKQHFAVSVDTAHLNKPVFTNSPDNLVFLSYQAEMAKKGMAADMANRQLKSAVNPVDSAHWDAELKKTKKEISGYRKDLIKQHPNTLIAALMRLMEEPEIPPATQHPGGHYDSSFAYRYFKDHYWDGINFWDDRITRTPASLFEDRLDKYYNTLVVPHPDSTIRELNWMLGYASASKEMTRYLLVKFITRYLNQKYMWEDAVYVHLFEKYFANKDYDWLTPQGKKMITERAYNLMANIMGNKAEDIALPDSAGTIRMLYADTATYTLVCIWDPTCGHCKETLPKLDSMYRSKWKAAGLHIYAMARETEGKKKDWTAFISDHQLQDWTHVYYSKEDEKMRVDAGIPSYIQLYDAQTVPTLYLLDRDKRIMAKKLSWDQIDEILQLKLKNQ